MFCSLSYPRIEYSSSCIYSWPSQGRTNLVQILAMVNFVTALWINDSKVGRIGCPKMRVQSQCESSQGGLILRGYLSQANKSFLCRKDTSTWYPVVCLSKVGRIVVVIGSSPIHLYICKTILHLPPSLTAPTYHKKNFCTALWSIDLRATGCRGFELKRSANAAHGLPSI